MTSWTPSRWI